MGLAATQDQLSCEEPLVLVGEKPPAARGPCRPYRRSSWTFRALPNPYQILVIIHATCFLSLTAILTQQDVRGACERTF